MTKEIRTVEGFKNPNSENKRQTVIITTDDGVRYIFDVVTKEVNLLSNNDITVKFSHRFYPEREKGEKRDAKNYRVPRLVSKYMRKRYAEVEYMDGMTKEAQRNKKTVRLLRDEPDKEVV